MQSEGWWIGYALRRTGVEKGEAGEALQSVVLQVRHGWVHMTYLAKLDYLSPGIALYMVSHINLSATGKACCDEKTNANADITGTPSILTTVEINTIFSTRKRLRRIVQPPPPSSLPPPLLPSPKSGKKKDQLVVGEGENDGEDGSIRTKVSQEQAAMRAGKKGGREQARRRPWKATRNNIAMNTRVSAITRNCDL
ncbi:hypothetical protein ALC60_08335 [Trachymyrmex zeteki]|uniref:Uncharacterized protein n=1 Tax=Mycetomoellerius zeteki TaxID=64791 RepID=A0A151WXS6_9HYME|nr:hypothetical protein ALC60_08335 [Trachymyrmex zeteki]